MTQYLLHSKISGQGETIVMLHGYLSSSQYFKHFRKQFDGSHRVIALDLLGFGQSPKPKVSYTYQDHMAAIEHTLTVLNVKKPFILLGHSMGALISLRYAAEHASSVKKLLLFNPPLYTDRAQMTASHLASERRYKLMLYSPARHVLWPLLKIVPRASSNRRTPINFTDTVRMSKPAREGSYHNIIGGASVLDDFSKLTMPTLLVVGKADRVEYIDNLKKWNLPEIIDLKTIDADHHVIVRDQPLSEALVNKYL